MTTAQLATSRSSDRPDAGREPSQASATFAEQAADALAARALGIEVTPELALRQADADFVARVPIAFARRHTVLGLAAGSGDNGRLPLAVADLAQHEPMDVVARFLGRPVRPVFVHPPGDGAAAAPKAAAREMILLAINAAYQQQTGQADHFIASLDRQSVLDELRNLRGREDLLDTSGRAPVIKLVNLMLFEAVQQQASDVHLQPYEDTLVVRLRIDGVLEDRFDLPKGLQEEIVSRIKVMGRMNIAEKRLAQDGRATVRVGDRVVDLRLASLPTSYGERVVIRLLDKSARLYTLAELGMPPEIQQTFRGLITCEHGIILVTGPTGSGKTTTLYAALQEINTKQRNILTLEDPIEYQLSGVSQTQVSDKKGMTFASGLRSVLRQDPDIIMVGEIRDHETAAMAVQSALTGHLVFSTLHTNDAASAITRLLDLGIEPYLVASSVVGVLAQRLVRRICRQCGRPHPLTADDLTRMGLRDSPRTARPRMGSGCDACRNTGYRGRTGLVELLVVDEAVRRHVAERSTAAQIKATAMNGGMITLRDCGIARVLEGITTIEEVHRVTMRATV